jgi:hypothetical protein
MAAEKPRIVLTSMQPGAGVSELCRREGATVAGGRIELGPASQNVVLTLGGADIQSGKMFFDHARGTGPAAGG